MRIITLFGVICLLFSVNSYAVKIIKSQNSIIYKFNLEKNTTKEIELNDENYIEFNLNESEEFVGIYFKEGYPKIPVIRFFVEREIEDINIVFEDEQIDSSNNKLKYEIVPIQESVVKTLGSVPNFIKNSKMYSSNSYYPDQDNEVKLIGSKRGKKVYQVTVFPFKYNPVTMKYKLKKKVEVSITLKEDLSLIGKNSVLEDKNIFVFIIGERFWDSPALNRYIGYKLDQGFEVVKVDVTNRMVASDVRSQMRSLWQIHGTDLKYAMIIGDIEDVPSYETSILRGNVTDHYYRAIDVDAYSYDIGTPDIGLGRVTVKSEKELDAVISKFIRYQSNDFDTIDWLNKVSFIATKDTNNGNNEVAEGSHDYAIDSYMNPYGFYGNFPNDPMAGGDRLYAIRYRASDRDVMKNIKNGRLIINYSGHGSNYSWAGPNVSQNDVRSIKDNGIYPFVISNACVTGNFTKRESFGETWIKHPGGAILFWGSMNSTYWDEDDVLERHMYNGIFQNGFRAFSNITQYALSKLWQHYGGESRSKYYWETYVMFGDPSISLLIDKY